ncbi:dUTP diphosphatase [Virgibacillus sp. C22-A2]|uniref:dUTP diphosphatase n=1 Tax=Virgibacillus tibetensis TaxID=3042313 RepID=A0ABU6K9Q7_9BACI|nr:dUTP diphosphatase [Virgibacillus sp. C22-A2]
MDWTTLYTMQAQLDKYIETKNNLNSKSVFQEKCLALLVELGELANETRCFKFWSSKSRNEKHVILEEYVDGIHFILSLGIEKGHHYVSKFIQSTNCTETEQFNEVFEGCIMFKKEPNHRNYEKLFESYIQLGNVLGFTETEIQEAYLKKNEVNYERQNQGY